MPFFSQTNICGKILKKSVIDRTINESEIKAFYQKINLSPSLDFLCPRKAYYNIKYSGLAHLPIDSTDITYENERAKTVGNNFHDFIQKEFEIAGVLRLNETTLEDTENKIRARLDSVIEVDGELVLIELKSSKSYSIHLMNQNGSPDPEHIKQIQLYFHLLELNKDKPEIAAVLKGRTITNGVIMYESKNDHKILEFLIVKNDTLIKDLLRYTNYVWNSFLKKEVPRQKFEPDSVECMYKCNKTYYEMCHGKPKPVKDLGPINIWGSANINESKNEPNFREIN